MPHLKILGKAKTGLPQSKNHLFFSSIYLLKPSVDNFDNGLANVTHTGLEDQMDFIKNIITFFSKKISKYFP